MWAFISTLPQKPVLWFRPPSRKESDWGGFTTSVTPSCLHGKQNGGIDRYGNLNVLGYFCAFQGKHTQMEAVLISLCFAWNWLEEVKEGPGFVLWLISPGMFSGRNQSFTSAKEPGKTRIDFHSFSNWQRSIDLKGLWCPPGGCALTLFPTMHWTILIQLVVNDDGLSVLRHSLVAVGSSILSW